MAQVYQIKLLNYFNGAVSTNKTKHYQGFESLSKWWNNRRDFQKEMDKVSVVNALSRGTQPQRYGCEALYNGQIIAQYHPWANIDLPLKNPTQSGDIFVALNEAESLAKKVGDVTLMADLISAISKVRNILGQ